MQTPSRRQRPAVDAPVPDGSGRRGPFDLRDVLRAHLRTLRQALSLTDRETATHEARRALKQIRGVLRLAQPSGVTADASLTRCDRSAKALADRLAPARDQRVAARTAEALAARVDVAGAAGLLALVAEDQHRAALRLEGRTAAAQAGRGLATLAAAVERLEVVRTFDQLAETVRLGHRKARRRLDRALADQDAEGLHRARTAIVRLHVQLATLDGLSGGLGKRLARQRRHLDALRSVLGEHHDLVLLGPLVAGHPAAGDDARRATLAAVDARLRTLERRAARLAGDALGETPSRLHRRLLRKHRDGAGA